MRKRFWLATLSIALAIAAGIYAYLELAPPRVQVTRISHQRMLPTAKNAMPPSEDAETSELIEPLRVETIEVPPPPHFETSTVTTRVQLTPGMQQPPRPDRDPGKLVRMPYADEDEIFVSFSFDPVLQMLESTLPRLNLFEKLLEQRPMEESEEPTQEEVAPLTEAPQAVPSNPSMDYHRQHPHCPYHGGCPYPYYPRR